MRLKRLDKKTLATECRHNIYVQTLTQTKDNEGGFTDSWADSASFYWAAILPLKAVQKFNYKSVNEEVTHMIKVRGEVSITSKQRIRFGSRYFEIKTVENVQERDIVQWVLCKERV